MMRFRTRRLNERHRTVMMWTLLCAGGASFAALAQMMHGAIS